MIEKIVKTPSNLELVEKVNEVAQNANTANERIEEVFTSVSNGKTLIASAITDKGVPTQSTVTFAEMAQNVLGIGGLKGFLSVESIRCYGSEGEYLSFTLNGNLPFDLNKSIGILVDHANSWNPETPFCIWERGVAVSCYNHPEEEGAGFMMKLFQSVHDDDEQLPYLLIIEVGGSLDEFARGCERLDFGVVQ